MNVLSAPAKIILLGEHAVVYGQPAIAVPVADLRATATVEPASAFRIVAADLNRTLDLETAVDDALALTARLVLQALDVSPPPVSITLRSQIPLASGLGSGAAVSAALARALCAAVGRTLSTEQLNALVYEVEKLHHGTPSGIDNTVIVYQQPVYFVRGRPIERLKISGTFHLLVADTGRGALTRVAVGDVRRLYETDPDAVQPVLDAVGALVAQARRALEQGDAAALGRLMCENHAHLQRLTVSSPELDMLVDAALAAGALGAKLSGGGRGGNMIALVTSQTHEHVETALHRAGAVRVFSTRLSADS